MLTPLQPNSHFSSKPFRRTISYEHSMSPSKQSGSRSSSMHLTWNSFHHKQTKACRNKHKVGAWTLCILLLPRQAVWQLPSYWQEGTLLFFHLSSCRIFNAFSTVAFSFISLRTTTNSPAVAQPWTVERQKGNCFSLQPFHDSMQVVAGLQRLKDCVLKATDISSCICRSLHVVSIGRNGLAIKFNAWI